MPAIHTPAAAATYRGYILRTCASDMSSWGGFVWPAEGHIAAPDWKADDCCGHGLHGFLWGEGDGGLADWSLDAKWLVAGVNEWVDLTGKVKAPEAWVVHCGDRASATAFIQALGAKGAIVGGTATAGDSGTATAGYRGTATAGDRGTVMVKWWHEPSNRYRFAIGYPGEDGIKPNTAYRADANGRLVEVQA